VPATDAMVVLELHQGVDFVAREQA
jgi:hypothetical protein